MKGAEAIRVISNPMFNNKSRSMNLSSVVFGVFWSNWLLLNVTLLSNVNF